VSAGETLRVRHRPGLGDDLEAGLVVDQEPEALTNHRVVVGDDDGGLAAVGRDGAHGGSIPFRGDFGHMGRHDQEATDRRSARDPGAAADSIRSFPLPGKIPLSGFAAPVGTINTGQTAVRRTSSLTPPRTTTPSGP